MTTVVWFRQDLRIRDNPALAAAHARGKVAPIFILDDVTPGPRRRWGGASRWWLHHSLVSLRHDLGHLALFKGAPSDVLPAFIEKVGATAVFWNRCYEPYAIARDQALKASLQAGGIEVQTFNGSLLHEPWEVATASGAPYKVYTPYWRASLAKPVAAPLPAIKPQVDASVPPGDRLDDWQLLPTRPNWAAGWQQRWQPGEAGALEALDAFARDGLADYSQQRDRPDLKGTSRLSPHLHWGEISPRQIWARLGLETESPSNRKGAEKFLSELGWREFCHHLLYHFPTLPERNWRRAFDAFPWRQADGDLKAWQQGMTGYPLVDAGMRELWQTGWMHNRVRMVAASFLVKHLRIDWRRGEAWFWDTLVDADLANNAAGWQWVAGSGADASPYFRIFNPVTQGKKFDPDGDYVRRWCPELARLPDEHIHAPFDAPPETLAAAGVELGRTYPRPIVDHARARKAALDGYEKVRSAGD
ncbi:MAG: DNA photolyase family protein [Xanthobacteraceae bacterium]|nr:DNA photolyase family protein [Xanthobacteraceae bacterium]